MQKPAPLTRLSEEEELFYSTVRQFAEETIAPLVHTMDEEQQMAPALVKKLFELGLMGIEAAEEHGGAAGSFFDAALRSRRSRRWTRAWRCWWTCTTRL